MLVAVTGLRILLAVAQKRVVPVLHELDRLLGTVLDAGETELAVARCLHVLRRQTVVAARADIHTCAAAYAGFRKGETVLALHDEAGLRIYARPFQKAMVLLSLLLRHRLMPMATDRDIRRNLLRFSTNKMSITLLILPKCRGKAMPFRLQI